ncbi:MAG: GntR family transcriptional regulator [Pararhizobium sp.]
MNVVERSTRRGGATDRLTDALRRAIVALELTPGQAIDKEELTRRYGVSRFPIAEALKRLAAEKLVEIRPQSGTRVSPIRLSDAYENLFLRRALESEAVEVLCARGTTAVLAGIERNLRYQKAAVEARDRNGFHELDVEFHSLLVSALPYPRIRAIVENARLALDRARRLMNSPRRHELTYREHVAIVAALSAHDGPAARAAMAAHIDAVTEELSAFSKAHPEAFSS